MNRKEAIAKIKGVWTEYNDEQAGKYLDRLIDLCEPEFDDLKTDTGEVGGTKGEHLLRMAKTFWKNEHGGW